MKGLTTAALQGRAQIVPDRFIENESLGDLVFYLDGAHSPESMDVCAKWFCLAIKEDFNSSANRAQYESSSPHESGHITNHKTTKKSSTQVMFCSVIYNFHVSYIFIIYRSVWHFPFSVVIYSLESVIGFFIDYTFTGFLNYIFSFYFINYIVILVDADKFDLLENLQILLFNCMSVRDPQLLLPRLMNACASHGKN